MKLKESATLALNEKSKALEAEGRRVYKFGFGQSPFPVPDHALAALKKYSHKKEYTPAAGILELREEIAAYYDRTFSLKVEAQHVIVAPGSKPLLYFIQAVLEGYELVLPKGSWVSYAPQAELLGRKVLWIETGVETAWKPTPEALDAALKSSRGKKLLILNYPNNPTGQSFSADELKALAEVLRSNEALVLADEIYAEFSFSGTHESMMTYYPEGTIITSGLSKWAGAGGWRLGYALASKDLSWLTERLSIAQSECLASASTPVQLAACDMFRERSATSEYVRKCNSIIEPLSKQVCEMLNQAGLTTAPADGGFYLFPSFEKFREELLQKGITTSDQLSEQLLEETGVALLPGTAFGCDPEELVARLSYVSFDGEKALKGITEGVTRGLEQSFLKQFCEDTLEGVEILLAWLAG